MEFRSIEVEKILLIFSGLCILAFNISSIVLPPASGYEITISSAYPSFLWIALPIGISASVLVIFVSALNQSPYWKHAFVLILCGYFIYLVLPLLRGYALYGRSNADILAHLGFTRTIIETGHYSPRDFYPGLHLLFGALNLIGVPMDLLRALTAPAFTIFYILSIFLFGRRLAGNRRGALFILACAVPLTLGKFYANMKPSTASFMLLPLVLFLVHAGRNHGKYRYWILVALIGIGTVIYHPISAILLVLAIGVEITGCLAYERQYESIDLVKHKIEAWIGAIVLILTPLWFLSFERGRKAISGVGGGLRANEPPVQTETPAETSTPAPTTGQSPSSEPGQGVVPDLDVIGNGILQKVVNISHFRGITLDQMFMRFFELYGATFQYVTLGGVLTGFLFYRQARHRLNRIEFTLGLHYVVGFIFALVYMLFPLVIGSPVRVSRYMVLFGTILIGLATARYLVPEVGFSRTSLKSIATVAVILLIVLAVPLGMTATYRPNFHLTHSENQGVEWIVKNHDPDVHVYSLAISQKHTSYLLGEHRVNDGGSGVFLWRYGPLRPDLFPRHLGYDENDTIRESFGPGYLVTKEHDRQYYKFFYENQQDSLTYYTEEDMEELSADPTAHQIYENGGFEVWRIPSARNATSEASAGQV